jgi:hypothetical protein
MQLTDDDEAPPAVEYVPAEHNVQVADERAPHAVEYVPGTHARLRIVSPARMDGCPKKAVGERRT